MKVLVATVPIRPLPIYSRAIGSLVAGSGIPLRKTGCQLHHSQNYDN
jgi:hypothetical protein